ncbi:predicted protein [Lichtheimia corymbifera JMRC:FSU:9682]|uniref:K Homology domain-containing protein n=1 Tax=Lichtheimia corymbifera JMRC:FSU:9682 TaxID=1263082 RepID=A0A068RRD2_9FUNG|nr:predicted protein [Lichtheimia corymbifera JMRC:FSU:9682]
MSIVPSNASQVPYDDNEQEESLRDPTIMPDQMHMDCYILPPDHSLTDVLGEKHSMLDEIRQDTGASLKYNASMYQVDIWGEKASVNRAKQHLHQIVERLDEKAEPNRRRTEKWSKPERKVKTWEKRRVDRKAAQQAAQQIYQGYPDAPQPYNDTAEPRNDEVPLTKLLDTRDAFLDQIRASCKCWVYVDTNNDNIIHIAGQEKDRVIMARTRIRNWYSLNARLHRPYRSRIASDEATTQLYACQVSQAA